GDFSRTVARAMAKDRSQRQATAGELEKELQAALTTDGITSPVSLADLPSQSAAHGSSGVVTSPHQTAATIVTGIHDVDSAAPVQSVSEATLPTVIAATNKAAEVQPVPTTAPSAAAAAAARGQARIVRGAG